MLSENSKIIGVAENWKFFAAPSDFYSPKPQSLHRIDTYENETLKNQVKDVERMIFSQYI